jgi:hypothetical protein
VCGRRSGPQPGFVHLGPAKGDPQFTLYRVEKDILLEHGRPRPPAPGNLTRPPADWATRARRLASNLTPGLRDELADALGLPAVALAVLPGIGYDPAGGCWTFPEEDGAGRVVGIVRRYRDGAKRALAGSARGLTIPLGWTSRETPLLIVEGQSDALALALCAVSAVGRPSNLGGVEMLAELLAGRPAGRRIIVMGEHDRKPDGKWPGRDGAVHVARALAAKLQRPVEWALPPDGAKDMRDWILSRKPDPRILDEWHLVGEDLWV